MKKNRVIIILLVFMLIASGCGEHRSGYDLSSIPGTKEYFETFYAKSPENEIQVFSEEPNDDIEGTTVFEEALMPIIYDKNGLLIACNVEENGFSGRWRANSAYSIIREMEGRFSEAKEIWLTIDIKIQQETDRILSEGVYYLIKKREFENSEFKTDEKMDDSIGGGSAVIIDTRSGEVLALCSVNSPMTNCAVKPYDCGSVYMPCAALAALEKGYITENSTLTCEEEESSYCWRAAIGAPHGELTVEQAIRESCPEYFRKLSECMPQHEAAEYAVMLGLGSDLCELLSDDSSVDFSDNADAMTGHGNHRFSPLQLAVYTGALANGGRTFSSSLVEYIIVDGEKQYVRSDKAGSDIGLSERNINTVRTAMKVNDMYALKTGSSLSGDYKVNDAFNIAFTPYRSPNYAMCVSVEGGGSGAYISFITEKIIELLQ